MANKVVTIKSKSKENVLKSAKQQEVKIKSCCKRGICGLCKVKVIDGNVSAPTPKEIKRLGQDRIDNGYRLACQTEYSGKVTLEV